MAVPPFQQVLTPYQQMQWRRFVLATCGLLAGLSIAHRPASGQAATPSLLSPVTSINQVAQLPATNPSAGSQVLLNGRNLALPWTQWQAGGSLRTGVSDIGLMQLLGVELLNSETPTRQPVQWFSDPGTTPFNLPARLVSPFRYLDITDLARQAGWQMQAVGSQLQITALPARVVAVRQGSQPWGDRFVIELDRPATWQVDQTGQEFVLTFDASTAPEVVQAFQPRLNDRLTNLKLEPASNQTRLRLGIPLSVRPRVWSLPNPNRLIVDVRPDSMVDRNILWSPGLRWRSQILNLGSDRFSVNWLVVSPRQAGVRVAPILPNPSGMAGIAPLNQTARQSQVSAAINGGFFNRNNQLPLGAVRRDGRWLSGPILNRGAIGWNPNGEVKVDRLTLQESITTPSGQRVSLTHLNSGYVQAGIARYTPDWGASYTTLSNDEIVVSVQNNQVVGQQTIASVGTAVPIPGNGYLLVLRSNRSAASVFSAGTPLRLESTTSPPDFNRFSNILAAGPLLVQNRQVVLDAAAEKFSPAFISERASRSAIGYTADGNLLIATVHYRVDGTSVNLTEIAQLMQQLGAVEAVNLDGGSSTSLYLGGQVVDRPARTSARVHNGIGVFVRP